MIYNKSVMFKAAEITQKGGWENDVRNEPQMNPLCVEIWMWDSIETSDKTLRVTELLAPTVPKL